MAARLPGSTTRSISASSGYSFSCPTPYDDYDDEEDPGPPPPNYLVPSILVTLCCCTIGGIVAIVSASQVNSKWARGDYSGAYQASEKAKLWCWMSFAIGLVLNIILAAIEIAKEQNAGN